MSSFDVDNRVARYKEECAAELKTSRQRRKKLEAANTIGFDRIRMIDPEFGPDGDEITLSGFDVPIYTPPARGEVDPSAAGMDSTRAAELLDRMEDGDPTEGPDTSDDSADEAPVEGEDQ